jgi:hypothetical protein
MSLLPSVKDSAARAIRRCACPIGLVMLDGSASLGLPNLLEAPDNLREDSSLPETGERLPCRLLTNQKPPEAASAVRLALRKPAFAETRERAHKIAGDNSLRNPQSGTASKKVEASEGRPTIRGSATAPSIHRTVVPWWRRRTDWPSLCAPWATSGFADARWTAKSLAYVRLTLDEVGLLCAAHAESTQQWRVAAHWRGKTAVLCGSLAASPLPVSNRRPAPVRVPRAGHPAAKRDGIATEPLASQKKSQPE